LLHYDTRGHQKHQRPLHQLPSLACAHDARSTRYQEVQGGWSTSRGGPVLGNAWTPSPRTTHDTTYAVDISDRILNGMLTWRCSSNGKPHGGNAPKLSATCGWDSARLARPQPLLGSSLGLFRPSCRLLWNAAEVISCADYHDIAATMANTRDTIACLF
jgi:hypothetical protein